MSPRGFLSRSLSPALSFPPLFPQGHSTLEPARLSSDPGIPAPGPCHPQLRAPSALRRSLAPGPGRGGRKAPSRWHIPGRCCHQKTGPIPPPALPARPRASSSGFGARPRTRRSQFCAASGSTLSNLSFPIWAMGLAASSRDTSTWTSALHGLANSGLPQGSHYPTLSRLLPPYPAHSEMQPASSCHFHQLLTVAHDAPRWAG